jgi:hypothetical protein
MRFNEAAISWSDHRLAMNELSIIMFPEHGRLHVYGAGEDGVTAFTEYGIECLKQLIDDARAAGKAPNPVTR